MITAVLLASGLAVSQATASDRHFAFTYETTTAAKGTVEYEQHFVWERGSGFDTYTFRQEFEFGITDCFQLSFYLYDFNLERFGSEKTTKWAGSGVEAIYQLTDPNKSFIGSALYGEAIMNDQDIELEGKLLLQKNFGQLLFAYNAVVEAHWEEGYQNRVGVLEQTLGISYQVVPSFSIGLEAKQEVAFENWSHSGGNAVFVGPNLSFRKGDFFTAVTCLLRVSDVQDEPHLEFGTILGYHF